MTTGPKFRWMPIAAASRRFSIISAPRRTCAWGTRNGPRDASPIRCSTCRSSARRLPKFLRANRPRRRSRQATTKTGRPCAGECARTQSKRSRRCWVCRRMAFSAPGPKRQSAHGSAPTGWCPTASWVRAAGKCSISIATPPTSRRRHRPPRTATRRATRRSSTRSMSVYSSSPSPRTRRKSSPSGSSRSRPCACATASTRGARSAASSPISRSRAAA